MTNVDIFQELAEHKKPDVIPYNSREEVKRAIEDFRYLCTQSYYVVLYSMGLLSVTKETVEYAKVLCVPFDTSKKTARFPKEYLKPEDPKMHVAVVCYSNGKAANVLLIDGATIAKANRPMSKFGAFFSNLFGSNPMSVSEENNEYILRINNINNLRKYAFATVIGQLQGSK